MEAEKPTNRGASLLRPLFFQLLCQQLSQALVTQRPHWFVVAPDQVLRQLLIQICNAPEGLTVVEVPLVAPAASRDLAIVPRRPWRNQLVLNAESAQLLVKRTFLCFADLICR